MDRASGVRGSMGDDDDDKKNMGMGGWTEGFWRIGELVPEKVDK